MTAMELIRPLLLIRRDHQASRRHAGQTKAASTGLTAGI